MPSDDPLSVGGILRAAREHQGLSVNDIAERTRIRSTLIREIESDNFFGCGDTFYARGHVRSIAVTVGLDPVVVVAAFDATHGPSVPGLMTEWLPVYDPKAKAPARPPPRPHAATRATAANAAARSTHPPVRTRRSSRPQRSAPSWISATVAAATVVALLSLASFLLFYSQGPQPPNAGGTQPSSTPVSPDPTPSVSPTPASPEEINLQITVTSGSTWIRVNDASGKEVFQGVLDTGDVKSFSDPRSLTVRFGNSSAANVVVNGIDKGTPSCGAAVCSETYKLDE